MLTITEGNQPNARYSLDHKFWQNCNGMAPKACVSLCCQEIRNRGEILVLFFFLASLWTSRAARLINVRKKVLDSIKYDLKILGVTLYEKWHV